jgi:hypothetical protein
METGWLDQLPAGDKARFDPSIKTAAELAGAGAGAGGVAGAGAPGTGTRGRVCGGGEQQPADLRASAA